MDETPISVTQAARKFSDCINRVRYQGKSFILEKNGVPVARIIPVLQNFESYFEQLTRALGQTRKTPTTEQEAVESTPQLNAAAPEPKQPPEPAMPSKRPALNW